MNHKTIIKTLLQQDELGKAIQEMLTGTSQNGQDNLNSNLIILSSQYHSNERNNHQGTVDRDSYRRSKAKIMQAALSYLEDYQPLAGSSPSDNGKTSIQQTHYGKGDNVGGNKIVNTPTNPRPNSTSSSSSKDKILFIAANPTDLTRLQTDREHRIIKKELERGGQRDKYEFLPPQFGVTIQELVRAINDLPEIVHFSGHGSENGIMISNEDNTSRVMPMAALRRMFKRLEGHTKLVILNSCYSADQAEEISKFGMYVVGYNLPVGDTAAISFAGGLYIGLGEGKSFEDAFDDAMIILETEAPKYADRVEIWQDGVLLEW